MLVQHMPQQQPGSSPLHPRPAQQGCWCAAAGQLPLQWPKIFRRVEYVLLSFNDLSAVDTSGNPVASVLPAAWTSEQMRGFPALSMLTLYPGNDYLCSVPTVEGGFEDINIGACMCACKRVGQAREAPAAQQGPTLGC